MAALARGGRRTTERAGRGAWQRDGEAGREGWQRSREKEDERRSKRVGALGSEMGQRVAKENNDK